MSLTTLLIVGTICLISGGGVAHFSRINEKEHALQEAKKRIEERNQKVKQINTLKKVSDE